MEHRTVALTDTAIQAALRGLPLGGLRVLQSTGSTNDEALQWASAGAGHLALVVADEQTGGRGRGGRKWLTPPGSALALSLVLRRSSGGPASGRLSGLGAMAVADACGEMGLQAHIKWPNDVLLNGRKVAGVLVESRWNGEEFEASILGIGINVLAASRPGDAEVQFPAISLEDALSRAPDRIQVLRLTLESILRWLPDLQGEAFRKAWEQRLAFRGEPVRLVGPGAEDITGILEGLEADGGLRIHATEGVRRVRMGEVHLLRAGDRMTREQT